jgi:hypothetical protein
VSTKARIFIHENTKGQKYILKNHHSYYPERNIEDSNALLSMSLTGAFENCGDKKSQLKFR